MFVSQISKGQVCYQEQLATSRYSRGPSQSKPQENPPCPTEAVYVEAQDASGFHPNLKRYWHSAKVLELKWLRYELNFILQNCPVWRGLPDLSNSVLPDLFPVCKTVTYWNHINWNNSKLKISPERVSTSCWIHLNKDCQQKKHLPNHSCDLENSWSVNQFQLLYHKRSFIPWFITELTQYTIVFFQLSSYRYPFHHLYRDFSDLYRSSYTTGKWEWKYYYV